MKETLAIIAAIIVLAAAFCVGYTAGRVEQMNLHLKRQIEELKGNQ